MDTFFHFPPDLFNLLVDTIPRLNKSKRDLLIFFQSVGVPEGYLRPFYDLLNSNNSQFKKFNVTRELLCILNQQTDKMLGVRRQLLKRVIEFDSFVQPRACRFSAGRWCASPDSFCAQWEAAPGAGKFLRPHPGARHPFLC